MMIRICAAVLALAGLGMAQGPMTPPGMPMRGPGFYSTFEHHGMGPHEWWKNPDLAQKLGISDAQIQKLNQIVQDHRLKMIDLRAALEREQVRLEPMMDAANPDENQILAQIDKVSVQRAQVEKAAVQLRLAIRRVLTPEQWKKLQSERHLEAHRAFVGHGPGAGPNMMFFRREFRGPGQSAGHPDAPPAPEGATPPQEQ